MRAEFKRLHRELGTTTLYATPDQLEALSIGERVARDPERAHHPGRYPDRLYAEPIDRDVASLIGDPPINLVKGTLKPGAAEGPTVELPFMELDGGPWREGLQALDGGTELLVGIRPHDLTLVDDGADGVPPRSRSPSRRATSPFSTSRRKAFPCAWSWPRRPAPATPPATACASRLPAPTPDFS